MGSALRKDMYKARIGHLYGSLILIFIIMIQASGNTFGQNYEDLVRITADFIPDDNEYTENTYDMNRLSLSYTNGSRLCPSNSCIFQFQEAEIRPHTYDPSSYVFTGVLRVGTPDSSGGTHYNVYDTRMDLKIVETTERPGTANHTVIGPVNFGEIEYEIYDGALAIGGGGVMLDINAQNPIQQEAYSSASSMIEGEDEVCIEGADEVCIVVPEYYPAQSTNGSEMQVVDIKTMYHNGSNPVQVQYRNETLSLDIPSYEECIRTLKLHQDEALFSLGVRIHLNSTIRVYDECVERQATQEAGPLEIEMLYADDPNNVIQKLSMGGICVFDDNLKALEEELGTSFSQPARDKLQLETEIALNKTAAAMGGVPAPVTEQECTVKQTWLRSLDS